MTAAVLRAKATDIVALVKPRIMVMALLTAAGAMSLAPETLGVGAMLALLAGTGLIVGSGGPSTRAIVEAHDLADAGQPGERWDGNPPATLERILFHLLQEYARHLGHLDIATELAGGLTGE